MPTKSLGYIDTASTTAIKPGHMETYSATDPSGTEPRWLSERDIKVKNLEERVTTLENTVEELRQMVIELTEYINEPVRPQEKADIAPEGSHYYGTGVLGDTKASEEAAKRLAESVDADMMEMLRKKGIEEMVRSKEDLRRAKLEVDAEARSSLVKSFTAYWKEITK